MPMSHRILLNIYEMNFPVALHENNENSNKPMS